LSKLLQALSHHVELQVAVPWGTWQHEACVDESFSPLLKNANQPNKLASPKIVSPCLELLFCKLLRKQHKVSPLFRKLGKRLHTFLRGNQI
jgi:hypothetical protein